MFGWSMIASACRSASKRATTCRVSMPRLENLERNLASDWLGLLGQEDYAEGAFANLFEQLVRADGSAWASRGACAMVSAMCAAGFCKKPPARK